jgi:hypothetical protein
MANLDAFTNLSARKLNLEAPLLDGSWTPEETFNNSLRIPFRVAIEALKYEKA